MNLAQLFGIRPKQRSPEESLRSEPILRWITITSDEEFHTRIQKLAAANGWEARRARDVADARELLDQEAFPIVLYDWSKTESDWTAAVDQLTAHHSRPCVLMASPVVDNYLWHEVRRHQGYEVLARSAGLEAMARILRFAWFWTRRARLSTTTNSIREARYSSR